MTREGPAASGGRSQPELPDEDAVVFEAPALLRVVWADPQHMPEHLALWSLKHFAPRASSAIEDIRSSHPSADTRELERIVIERQTRVAMAEGAVVGGPFLILLPVAFCAALLAQAHMVLELAALAGYAPDDEMRAADLLVLQGAYPATAEAGAALRAATRNPGAATQKKLPRGTRWSMLKRMAFMLGVLGTTDVKPGLARTILQWAFLGLMFLLGIVLPLIWVPYMAVSVRRSALRMGARATRFYSERQTVEAGVAIRKRTEVRVGISGGLMRLLALILLPILVAAIAFSTDLDLGGGRLLSAAILLLAVSALVTFAWLARHWWRHRRFAGAASAI